MTGVQQGIFWLGAFAVFCALVWVLGDILTPFVVGAIIAYLLNPLVSWFGRYDIPRGLASLIILGSFLIIVSLVLVLSLPQLFSELEQLVDDIPDLVRKLWMQAQPYVGWLQEEMGDGKQIASALKNNLGSSAQVLRRVAFGVVAGGQALIGFLSFILLMPIAAYFMMKEWPGINAWFVDLMPRHHKDTILGLLGQVNEKLAGFIRGQLMVMVVLGALYAVALTLAGLNYGALIGLVSGLLSIVPLLGSTIGLLVSVIVAWYQTGEWTYMLLIAAIYLGGQLLEGNLITPKLVGEAVGMHPLWVLFVVIAGGALFGVVGILLAVPVAASVGVLVAFGIKKYKQSSYYKPEKKNS